MKSVPIALIVFIVVAGAEDNFGARTFGTSHEVVGSHSAHHHDHHTHVIPGHDHTHQPPQPATVSVSSDAIQVKTVPVFIGQIVNVRVVSMEPQASGGSIGTSAAISSLVDTQQQLVGNITAGFGNAVQSFVSPVVALLHNASVWLNRTSHNSSFLKHQHDHTHAAHAAIHSHASHHGHVHGNGQPSAVGSIPVLVIDGQQIPAATIGAGFPTSLGLSPVASSEQVLTLGNPVQASGSQFFSFAAPAPVAALGDFLASAVAPILGAGSPTSTFGATEGTSTVSTAPALANGTVTASVFLGGVSNTTANLTPGPETPLAVVSTKLSSLAPKVPVTATAPLQPTVASNPKNGAV
ncbi:unnamed protein product [Ixodes hexagonus]